MAISGSDHLLRPHGTSLPVQASVTEALRCALVIGALLLIWLTFEPFANLRNQELTEIVSGTLALTYLTFGALALLAVSLCASDSMPALRSLGTRVNVAFICWMGLNILASHLPGLSLQRFMLTASVTALAFMMPLLPASRAQLNLCLAIAAGLLLAICYLGILLIPDYAIHSSRDAVEANLNGDWRGAFSHKNIAAPVMAILLYLGLYLIRTELTITGWLIATAAALFLLNSGGKSSSGFCIGILLLVQVVVRLRSFWAKCVLCFIPVLLMNVLTVGSAASPAIAGLIATLPIDTSFTGRTGIWEFALTGFAARPILGYGYGAFWQNPANQTSIGSAFEWAQDASHSHNGYLELALTIGLPGLLLALAVLLYVPLRNFHRIQHSAQDQPLAHFFLTVWLFGVYLSTMETFLLDKQNPIWFLFVIAVAGLHYLSRFRLRQRS
ncbi:O-antigen ligase family protein [Tardiphaga sp.]|jgi:O-antigen ligase|uniref:O-antigen ligase family protein n=1 Tax=Tardiphaga sp. TaxID=1926292 RepID=UPI0037DA197B